jgi:cyclic beta-1,2-glucan synthetase
LSLLEVESQAKSERHIDTPHTAQPRIAILGSVPFTTIITNAGGGETRYGDITVNRWRSDPTLDDYGQWCYVRDVTSGRLWSASYQPVCIEPEWYHVAFHSDRAVFRRRDGDIETEMEVAVFPSSARELRTIRLTNDSDRAHDIELTSYGEIVITSGYADRHHPAFQNLFVQTEWLPDSNSILAMRRPRSADTKPVWLGHSITVSDPIGNVSCETDRARFLGRGRSARNPAAMDKAGELSGRVGAVLDPVFAIRARVRVPPGATAEVVFTTLVSASREDVIEKLDQRKEFETESANDEAPGESALYQDLAGAMLFPESRPSRDLAPGDVKSREPGQLPVLLASLQLTDGVNDAKELVRAQRYLQKKGFNFDVVILAHGQHLADAVSGELDSRQTGVRVIRSDILDGRELARLQATSRLRAECDGSGITGFQDFGSHVTESPASPPAPSAQSDVNPVDGAGLQFFNGIGGFNESGEYEIRLTGFELPPAPWINVIANGFGGFIASEVGVGCTWIASASSFRLTPWNNDPVSNRPGECIYLRDEDTRELWSATPAPIREGTPYTIRHGAGYSAFDHEHAGILTTLRMGMAPDDPVKVQVLTLTNSGDRPRRITATAYVEWVLGATRERTRFDVQTTFDRANSVVLAQNPLDPDMPTTTAFLAMTGSIAWYTTSRREFVGRNGTLSAPTALAENRWAEQEETIPDPCGVLGGLIELAPGQTKSIAIVLGAAESREEATQLASRYRDPGIANAAIDSAASEWDSRLSAISVRTPDPAFDLMINKWAFYQALSCRVWGRNALYQSSGACGFRDQLQDVTAFVYAEPSLARDQIVKAAGRQFVEGDVQHWWHPHSGRGLRTRFSDDLVWLPFVVDHYLQVTGDHSVLDERTPYLTMRALEENEEELYAMPETSEIQASVFDHCIHILNRAATTGRHGLPLMGSGDWNDGMNRVGIGGKGESVWLAWFLATTLRRFAVYAESRGYTASAESFRKKADAYVDAVEQTGWDGEWYRRAYYDDGSPLGSHVNIECRIDSIAQSWSVISNAGDPERRSTAMTSLHRHLVREDARLIMLLTPAFDRGTHDPGYIQGYLPGVRENGAQYTHAALWAVMATALQGDGDRAMKLYQMINPITHAMTPEDVDTYKVEPYVVAADVYTAEGHVGRGGWTWYTGSASWLYRVGLESILGFSKRGDSLVFDPCIPSSWKEFTLDYRFGSSVYHVLVSNPSGVQKGVASVSVDGVSCEGAIPLVDDGAKHSVNVTLG